MRRHIEAAAAAAGEEHVGLFERLCEVSDTGGSPEPPPAPADRPGWYAAPARVFDNLYFIGTRTLNSYAIVTSEGIVVIDPMYDYSVDMAIVDGLERLGFDPRDISHVIVSHGHGDHYGGARQLQRDYGAQVMLSAADWTLIFEGSGSQPKPDTDRVVEDGEVMTLGDTRFLFTLTPGHTQGTISTIFTVEDGGVEHAAAIWGGTSMREDLAFYQEYSSSAQKFARAIEEAEADVLLSNHGEFDSVHRKLAALANRQEDDPHPFVIGTQATLDYLEVARSCAAAGVARLPLTPPSRRP